MNTRSLFSRWIRNKSFSMRRARGRAGRGFSRIGDAYADRMEGALDAYNEVREEDDPGYKELTKEQLSDTLTKLARSAEKVGYGMNLFSEQEKFQMAEENVSRKEIDRRAREKLKEIQKRRDEQEKLKKERQAIEDKIKTEMGDADKPSSQSSKEQDKSYNPKGGVDGQNKDDYRKPPKGNSGNNNESGGKTQDDPTGTANALTIWDSDGALSSLAGSSAGDMVYFNGTAWAKLAAPTGTSKTYFLSATTNSSGGVSSLSWVEGYECS